MPRDKLVQLHRLRLFMVEQARRGLADRRGAEADAETAVAALDQAAIHDREARRGSLNIESALLYRERLGQQQRAATARLHAARIAAEEARVTLTEARTAAEIIDTLRRERAAAALRKRRDME